MIVAHIYIYIYVCVCVCVYACTHTRSLFYCGFGFTGQTALISILHIVIIVTSSWFLFPVTVIIINELLLSHRKVDMTGEVQNLISKEEFTPGVYRVEFDTKAYWKAEGHTPFHQVADVSNALMALLYS